MAVSGNPQLNIRLEIDLMDKVKEKAEENGMRPQEWVRRLIKETLGEVPTNVVLSGDTDTATGITRDDIESMVSEAIAAMPQPEPVDIGGLNSRLDQLLDMQGDIIGRVNRLEDKPEPDVSALAGAVVSMLTETQKKP